MQKPCTEREVPPRAGHSPHVQGLFIVIRRLPHRAVTVVVVAP